MLYVSLHRDDCFNRGVCDNCTRQCISCDAYEVLYVLIMPRASNVLLLVNACIIASERSGVEVRVRVILRAVGNYVEHYGMATYRQNRPVQTTRSARSLVITLTNDLE